MSVVAAQALLNKMNTEVCFISVFENTSLVSFYLALSPCQGVAYYTKINDKNCSLSIVLTAMDQKLQKS